MIAVVHGRVMLASIANHEYACMIVRSYSVHDDSALRGIHVAGHEIHEMNCYLRSEYSDGFADDVSIVTVKLNA